MRQSDPENRKRKVAAVNLTPEQSDRVEAERLRRQTLAGVEVSHAMVLRRLVEERLDAIDAELAGSNS